MTTPIDSTVRSWVLKSKGANLYMDVVAGTPRTIETLALPAGDHILRINVTELSGNMIVRGFRDGANVTYLPATDVTTLKTLAVPISSGTPAWFALQPSTSAIVTVGVTLFVSPPTTA